MEYKKTEDADKELVLVLKNGDQLVRMEKR